MSDRWLQTYLRLAGIFWMLFFHFTAHACSDSSVAQASRKAGEVQTLLSSGKAAADKNDFAQAISFYTEALAICRDARLDKEMIEVLYPLAWTHFQLQPNSDKSVDYCYVGLHSAEKLNDQENVARFHSFLGTIHFFWREAEEALKHHFQALHIYKKLNRKDGIVSALCDVGGDYQALKDTVSLIRYYMQCKHYIVPGEYDKTGFSACLSIGAAYLMLRRYDSARVYCEKAYDIAGHMQNKRALVSSMSTLAKISYLQGNNTKAKQEAIEALILLKTINFPGQYPDLSWLLMEICLKEKDYKGALEAHQLYIRSRDSLSTEKNRKQAMEREYNYHLEKKQNENQFLAQQNKFQSVSLTALVIVLLLVFAIAYLAIRQNRLHARQQKAELEQRLMRSQMNPHFIFNSLQAIQNFIAEHGGEGAINYLGSFARVMRNVLENSRLELVPLKQEIELLGNYLQLQKLRFEKRFDYAIEVDEAIDLSHTAVPPMLTQPFIENAIEHGMHGIKSGGMITISYRLQKNELLVEVIDNGSGLRQPENSRSGHRSFALDITRERIALLNKKKKKSTFSIHEAFPHQTERKGVRICFNLPLIT